MLFKTASASRSQAHGAVTKFDPKGYLEHRKRCLQTALEYWPKEVPLLVRAEDIDPAEDASRIRSFEERERRPGLVKLKRQFRDIPQAKGLLPAESGSTYDARWDGC